MLCVVASDVLAVVDSSTLKRPPKTLPSCDTPVDEHHASAWAADNSAIYLCSAQALSLYDPSSKQLKSLHTLSDGYPIRCMVVKDNHSIFWGAGNHIHNLECRSQVPKLNQPFGPHKHDVLSLSLSNDSTLLACGLSNAVHVHNLNTGSQTTLRGLPSNPSIAMCVFHPHVRTRLLVGHGDQLLVYDTNRPSAPSRVIFVNDVGTATSAIACSPFSKTLVAVAMSDGNVGLVDLEKEKGLFRTLNLNVPLTTIAFSPEGASIYLGTKDGKLLVQDLRAPDKSPKSTVVSVSGNPINALAVQRKLKIPSSVVTTKVTPKSLTKGAATPSTSKAAPPPLRSRTSRRGELFTSTPTRGTSQKNGTSSQIPLSKSADSKKVLSATKNPLGNSSRGESRGMAHVQVKKAHPLATASVNSKSKGFSPNTTSRRGPAPVRRSTGVVSVTTELENTVSGDQSSIFNAKTRSRSQVNSSAPPPTVSTALRFSRPACPTPNSGLPTRRKLPPSTSLAPPGPSVSTDIVPNTHSISPTLNLGGCSRTPSPELPDMKTDLVTPILANKKKKNGMAILGFGTPEVTACIKAGMRSRASQNGILKGKGRVKSVGFKDGFDHKENPQEKEPNDPDLDEDEEQERERSLSLQISPRKPLLTSTSSQSRSHGPSHSWDAPPMRPRHTAHLSNTPSAGSAHELLRTIVKDVMYDFQKETKAEMMGLHLDLVRVGRGWKQELRTLMEEYAGDLNDLREENRRLREENDRLRRGF